MACGNNQQSVETTSNGSGYVILVVLYILLAIILGSIWMY